MPTVRARTRRARVRKAWKKLLILMKNINLVIVSLARRRRRMILATRIIALILTSVPIVEVGAAQL
jgi:hypothetical protein